MQIQLQMQLSIHHRSYKHQCAGGKEDQKQYQLSKEYQQPYHEGQPLERVTPFTFLHDDTPQYGQPSTANADSLSVHVVE